MSKLLMGISFALCAHYSQADGNTGTLIQALSTLQGGTQPQPNALNSVDPTNGVVTSLIQQSNAKVPDSPTSQLPKEGAWSVFQSGNWRPVSQNDNFNDVNIALLIPDLTMDKRHLTSLASWLSNVPIDLSSYNPATSSVISTAMSRFQLILVFEYPSMKSFKNKNGQDSLISSIAEPFAQQLIKGTKNVKSLTLFAHGLGGLVSRYALEKEFPDLIKSNENDYKDIYNKIRLITFGTPHDGIPSQVEEQTYKNCVANNIGDTLTSNLNQQAGNYLEQQKSNLLGQQTGGLISLLAPGLLSNTGSLLGSVGQKNTSDFIPVLKELQVNSEFLKVLNNESFAYADQTDYITIAGNKSAELQMGLENSVAEVGTKNQSLYISLDNTVQSDGLVSQYSAHAKELEKYCSNWAKNFNERAYNIAANHSELIGAQANQTFIQQVVPILIKIFNLPHSSSDSLLSSSSSPNASGESNKSSEQASAPIVNSPLPVPPVSNVDPSSNLRKKGEHLEIQKTEEK